jgi:hypothetical protein
VVQNTTLLFHTSYLGLGRHPIDQDRLYRVDRAPIEPTEQEKNRFDAHLCVRLSRASVLAKVRLTAGQTYVDLGLSRKAESGIDLCFVLQGSSRMQRLWLAPYFIAPRRESGIRRQIWGLFQNSDHMITEIFAIMRQLQWVEQREYQAHHGGEPSTASSKTSSCSSSSSSSSFFSFSASSVAAGESVPLARSNGIAFLLRRR